MEAREAALRELARRLRMARASAGLTQAETSRMTSLSQSAISLYEKAMREPNALKLGRLAAVYGCTTDWLLGLSDEGYPSRPEA